MAGFWRALPGGVSVAVRVQPGARRPGIGGVAGARLRIAVSEKPEGGRANRAACAALARALDIPPSAVSVAAGAASREKILVAAGDPALLVPRLASCQEAP